jgi:hypothetical protein
MPRITSLNPATIEGGNTGASTRFNSQAQTRTHLTHARTRTHTHTHTHPSARALLLTRTWAGHSLVPSAPTVC